MQALLLRCNKQKYRQKGNALHRTDEKKNNERGKENGQAADSRSSFLTKKSYTQSHNEKKPQQTKQTSQTSPL